MDKFEQARESLENLEPLWHYKGYYRIIPFAVTEAIGKKWVLYFIEQNSDDTYHDHKDAIENNFLGKPVDRDSVVFNSFYEDNNLKVASMDRLLRPSNGDRESPKYVRSRPKGKSQLKITHY